MKVYIYISQWENGRKFEGGVTVQPFRTLDAAEMELESDTKQAEEMIDNIYGSHVTKSPEHACSNHYRSVGDSEDYNDCWSGRIETFDI